jgi:hypothetical protein
VCSGLVVVKVMVISGKFNIGMVRVCLVDGTEVSFGSRAGISMVQCVFESIEVIIVFNLVLTMVFRASVDRWDSGSS